MDPIATLTLYLDALAEGDRDEAGEHAAAYNAWVRRGGFPVVVPTTTTHARVSSVCRTGRAFLTPLDGSSPTYEVGAAAYLDPSTWETL